MLSHHHTDEFSIILPLDRAASQDIKNIRGLMPASPFRDDPPHVTLLRGIHTTKDVSDQELLRSITPALDRLLKVEPHLHVSHLLNLSGGPYKISSAIAFKASLPLQREHISLVAHLRGNGYLVDSSAIFNYYPHATVRLGVPFDFAVLDAAQNFFSKGRAVGFAGWEILRLASSAKRRPFYELAK